MPDLLAYLRERATTICLLACLSMSSFYFSWDSYQLDFRAFYVAAQATAHHLDPYIDNRKHGEAFTDPMVQSTSSRWIYPPPALFAVAPMGRLSYTSARVLFSLASMLSVAAILVYISGRFLVADPWVMLAYISLPVIACFERGQIDIFVLSLLVLSFLYGKRFWAGVPLGIAIAIKIFPVTMIIWLLVQRRFLQLFTTIGCVAVLITLGEWRFGTSSYLEFIHNVTASDPARQLAPTADLVGRIGMLNVNGHWLALSHSLIGSYNNPLVLLGNSGAAVGLILVLAAAVTMRYRRVPEEIGFFAMVLLSQLVNTRLWNMGLVMYLPICLIMIAKLRSVSRSLAFALMAPLFLPSQIRIHGISPRFIVAIALVACFISASNKNRFLPDIAEEETQPDLSAPAICLAAPVHQSKADPASVPANAI